MKSDFRLFAEKLLAEIQKLDEASTLALMKNPPILHDAAKVGTVELIIMLTHAYPDLLWDLLGLSRRWMRNTEDNCMLIATIMLSVAFSAAFSVPGGNNGTTGIPILVDSNWFTCFITFEALALFGSTLCIITFWSITSSGFEEDQFLHILPYQLKLGITGLFGSLIDALSAFVSAYCLIYIEEGAWLVKSITLLVYVMLVLAIVPDAVSPK